MNNNFSKAILSFTWLLPFLYMFFDIYFDITYRIPSFAFKILVILSLVSAFILVLVWFKEFQEIRYLTKAFTLLKNEDLVKLNKILKKDKVETYIENDKTLIQYAIDNQLSNDTITYLISKNAQVTYAGNDEYNVSYTLFYLCSYYNFINDKIISYLLHQGADVNFIDTTKGFDGLSLLQVLILRSNKSAISLLIHQGADLGYFINDLSMNSLMLAAKYVDEPLIIKMLIEAGINVEETNKDGYNALLFACHYNPNPAVVNVLVNYGAKLKKYTVRSAILKYNDITPLLIASSYNNAEVVKTLIMLGDNVNYKDTFGLNPLFVSAAHNIDIDVIKTLISSGANIEKSKDKEGNTPLMAASYLNPNSNVIRYLIDKTHNLRSKNKDGFDFTNYLKQNSTLSDDEKSMILKWV